MTSDRFMHGFTRTDPWASLGVLRRSARIVRILFGCTLLISLLLMVMLFIHEIFAGPRGLQTLAFIAAVPFFLGLAWAVGCMYIWRPVHRGLEPFPKDPPPQIPPTEGAPRPAPLRPFSPLILSAHAELPDTPNT